VFPLSSHQVANMFPKFPMCSPTCSPYHLTFTPICFGKCWPPFTYIGGQKGRNSILKNRSFYFGGQSNWLIAKGVKKKKKKTWEAPHLINRSNSTKVSQLGKKWATRFIVDTLSNIKVHWIHATFVWNLLMEI
jgi:hypothetical protein